MKNIFFRSRLIVLAAAPGETLPQFPEPLHVVNPKGRALLLDIVLDGKRYSNGLRLLQVGAPYRTITVSICFNICLLNLFAQEMIEGKGCHVGPAANSKREPG